MTPVQILWLADVEWSKFKYFIESAIGIAILTLYNFLFICNFIYMIKMKSLFKSD